MVRAHAVNCPPHARAVGAPPAHTDPPDGECDDLSVRAAQKEGTYRRLQGRCTASGGPRRRTPPCNCAAGRRRFFATSLTLLARHTGRPHTPACGEHSLPFTAVPTPHTVQPEQRTQRPRPPTGRAGARQHARRGAARCRPRSWSSPPAGPGGRRRRPPCHRHTGRRRRNWLCAGCGPVRVGAWRARFARSVLCVSSEGGMRVWACVQRA